LSFSLIRHPPPRSTLFPYTTLFRSTLCYIPGHEVASVNNLVQLVTYINQTGNTPVADVTSPTDWGYPNTAGPSTLTTTSITPTQIGRASCRERVEITVVPASVKKKV